MNWNRQYRPNQISALHIKSVRQYFTKLLTASDFPQVFLFTGPKGTGKTSTARILAALFNEPKNADAVRARLFEHQKATPPLVEPDLSSDLTTKIIAGQSYFVHELDAASNRGIDDVRALRDMMFSPPTSGLVSVYILDEVHMLTSEAFNALLKILEEPPPHAICILATTEPQKIPATIISRCQVVQFSSAREDEIIEALHAIAKQEKLNLSDSLLHAIAEHAGGSFRDAIKHLQRSIQQELSTAEAFLEGLGIGSDVAAELVQHVLDKDAAAVISFFDTLRAKGVNESAFHQQLLTYLHAKLRESVLSPADAKMPFVAAQYLIHQLSPSELSQPSPIAFLRLEIVLLDIISRSKPRKDSDDDSGQNSKPDNKGSSTSIQSKKPVVEKEKSVAAYAQPSQILAEVSITSDNPTPQGEISVRTLATAEPADAVHVCSQWNTFVQFVAKQNFSLATLLKAAKPAPRGQGEIQLLVYYSFHLEQLCQPKFATQLAELIEAHFGGAIQLTCTLGEQPKDAELIEAHSPQLEKLAAEVLM